MMLIQLLILFFFIFNANSLKSSDLCFKQENQEGCTAGRNLHECEMNLCAFDHEACESFKTLRFHLKFGKSQKNEENTLAQHSINFILLTLFFISFLFEPSLMSLNITDCFFMLIYIQQ